MAKKSKKPATTAVDDTGVVSKGSKLTVVVRRDHQCGDKMLKRGDKLATLELHQDASLNYLVDAVRHGFAHQEPS